MSDDHFNYDQLMLNAHRELIRRVLAKVEQTGLPGEHHFFIIFSTTHPGTRISDRLRAQYPEDMTIVLQHQYSNLKVHPDRFEIQLSFNRIPELLVIPFAAITGFVDPSVPFGLQLAGEQNSAGLENSIGMLVPGLPHGSATSEGDERIHPQEHLLDDYDAEGEEHVSSWGTTEDTSVPTIFPAKKTQAETVPDADTGDKVRTKPVLAPVEDEEEETREANIVQLDAFRKKSK